MERDKRTHGLAIFLAVICLVLPASGQQSWEKKNYKQWSMADVVRILDDSPWAQTQIERVSINYGLPANSYTAVIRLRSALPIRQALVRRRQLGVNYDKFSAADKTRFDADVKEFLECTDCAKYYLVTLVSPVTTGLTDSVSVDVVDTLRGLSLAELKPHVYLTNDRGERSYLVGYIPTKGEGSEAMFVFPRFDEQGKPFLTPENKKFSFTIEEKVYEKRSIPLKKFTFEVSRIVRNGEVIF
ncbi:MAG TPA: hypothetical protein VJ715_07085 [Pyrinomonadaceae bacterium]|nr:hypothetical protein [Pyrinomonadaceae bacterium]